MSPLGKTGKVVGGTGCEGTDGSSSGSETSGAGKMPGAFDLLVSSQKTSILHARGSKLDFEDSNAESIATDTCFTLSAFFHITTQALSVSE